VVGHITPEAHEGGLIAFVHDDDIIEIDIAKNTISLKVSDQEIAKRKANWKQPELKEKRGVLYKYAMCVKDASEGCVTDEETPKPPKGGLPAHKANLFEKVEGN
jgi:dihydroxy-acid dehydratase